MVAKNDFEGEIKSWSDDKVNNYGNREGTEITSWLEVWFSSKSGHLVYIVKADIVSEYKGQGQWTSRVPDIDEVEVLDEVWDEIERSDRRYAIAYALFLLLEPSRSDDDLNKIRRDYWDAEIKKAEDRLQRVKALSQGA